MTDFFDLPEEVTKNGFLYKKETANGKVAIYTQVNADSGEVIGFEIFKVRFRKLREIKGRVLNPAFRFPENEAFGKWAWFAKTHEDAYSKLASLCDG